jgi:hypothetical protein
MIYRNYLITCYAKKQKGDLHMFGQIEIERWNEAYDTYKYPFRIYYELVVQNKSDIRKLELMGAWKTGSLRINSNGKEYKDHEGTLYGFTGKWKKEAPVGYDVWQNISNNIAEIKKKFHQSFQKTKSQM